MNDFEVAKREFARWYPKALISKRPEDQPLVMNAFIAGFCESLKLYEEMLRTGKPYEEIRGIKLDGLPIRRVKEGEIN